VFPLASSDSDSYSINIPIKNKYSHAVMITAKVDAQSASIMPLQATKQNIATILQQLQNRPYGWGGSFFFNDCSQELKSLFTPFGIWMPRNTAEQANMSGTIDLSDKSMDERISLLKSTGHPLMTMVYIGGHVMLYLGTQDNVALTYQSVWGLSPPSRDRRYVIGQSLFFPLLEVYPEYPDVVSLASKTYFKLINLDNLNTGTTSPQAYSRKFKIFAPAEPL